jgi:Pyridoxamine 5'-phosphate oxidase
MMTREEIYLFVRARRFAVVSTIMDDGSPESALVGIAVTPDLELIFDTTDSTRKCANLRRDPRAAFVIGWRGDYLAHTGGFQTMQYSGVADEPQGEELSRLLDIYLAAHPEGAERRNWPGLTYFRVRPRWVRYSTYYRPRQIEEISFPPGRTENLLKARV